MIPQREDRVMKRVGGLAAMGITISDLLSSQAMGAGPWPSETNKMLTADLMVEAAQAAIAECKSHGWNVSVTIADRSGSPRLVLMGDGAGQLSKEVTRRKAYTSAQLGISTGEFAKR